MRSAATHQATERLLAGVALEQTVKIAVVEPALDDPENLGRRLASDVDILLLHTRKLMAVEPVRQLT